MGSAYARCGGCDGERPSKKRTCPVFWFPVFWFPVFWFEEFGLYRRSARANINRRFHERPSEQTHSSGDRLCVGSWLAFGQVGFPCPRLGPVILFCTGARRLYRQHLWHATRA